MRRNFLFPGLVLLALLLSQLMHGCIDDRSPTGVSTEIPNLEIDLQLISCRADVGAQTLVCNATDDNPQHSISLSGYVTLGHQGVDVVLTSENVSYDGSSVFQADVRVQNLIGQALGTTDGVTVAPEGIRVFFLSDPWVESGQGPVTVANAHGTGTFTGSNQSYFQYDALLATGEASDTVNWQWTVGPDVVFWFEVAVSAPVQYPNGWIEVSPPDTTIKKGLTATLTATVRDRIGRALTGESVSWASSNRQVAPVDVSTGVVTAIEFGTAVITATGSGQESTGQATVTVASIDTIGASGGTLELPDGASVVVPAGAVSGAVQIQLAEEANTVSEYKPLSSKSYGFAASVLPGTSLTDQDSVILSLPIGVQVGADETPYIRAQFPGLPGTAYWAKATAVQDGIEVRIPASGLADTDPEVGIQATLTAVAIPGDPNVPSLFASLDDALDPPIDHLGSDWGAFVDCHKDPPLRRHPRTPVTIPADFVVVLVHGWLPNVHTCPEMLENQELLESIPGETYFGALDVFGAENDEGLIPALEARIGSIYPIYVFTYFTYEHYNNSAVALKERLLQLKADLDLNGVVLLAHSFGGLVSRKAAYLLWEAGSPDIVAGIITLGTPHFGSPLADTSLDLNHFYDGWVVTNLLTAGGRSLAPPGLPPQSWEPPIYAYAGNIKGRWADEGCANHGYVSVSSTCTVPFGYAAAYHRLCDHGGYCDADGLVEVSSAQPPSLYSEAVFLDDYSHGELHNSLRNRGNSDVIYDEIADDIAEIAGQVNRPPTVTITLPEDGSNFGESEAVTFEGSAQDPEEGSLTGGSLVWSSDLQGLLGTGSSVTRNDLWLGRHTVTLTAADTDGATGEDEIRVNVGGPADLTIVAVAGPATVRPGGEASVNVDVRNLESGSVYPGWILRLVLSDDQTVDPVNDRVLLDFEEPATMLAGDLIKRSHKVTIPTDVPDGTYYFGAYADATEIVSETNESNNSTAATTSTEVSSTAGDSYEPNDERAGAKLIEDTDLTDSWYDQTTVQEHSIYPAGDVDWVKFETATAADACIQVTRPSGPAFDLLLETSAGDTIQYWQSTSGGGLCFYNRPAGTYYVRVSLTEWEEQQVLGAYQVSLMVIPLSM